MRNITRSANPGRGAAASVEMRTAVFLALWSVLGTAGCTVAVDSGDDARFLGRTVYVGTTKRAVNAYTGIPYAERAGTIMTAPVYLARYAPEGSRVEIDAKETGVVAPQMDTNADGEREVAALLSPPAEAVRDALNSRTLDVFVPADATPASGHPVVVFLHGGFNISGSRAAQVNHGAGLLRDADRAAVVVVVEYSLGPLGFWYDPVDTQASNIAVSEVIAALYWVQDRITDFGGDPTRVSLAGHSAGAALAQHVHVALGAPDTLSTVPLFRTLVLMSGTAALLPAVPQDEAVRRQVAFGECVSGCAGITDPHLLRLCLQEVPIANILAAAKASPVVWTPTADGAVLPPIPTEIALEAGHFSRDVRVVFTVMRNDAAFFVEAIRQATESPTDDGGARRHKVPRVDRGVADVLVTMGVPISIANEISVAYTSGDSHKDLVDALTDMLFVRPAQRAMAAYSSHDVHVGLAVLSDTLDVVDPRSVIGFTAEVLARSRTSDGLRTASRVLSSVNGILGGSNCRFPDSVRERLDRAVDSINDVASRTDTLSASVDSAIGKLRRIQALGAFHGLEQCILFDAVAMNISGTDKSVRFRSLVTADQPRAVCVFHAAIAADEVPSDALLRSYIPSAHIDAVDLYALVASFMTLKRSILH